MFQPRQQKLFSFILSTYNSTSLDFFQKRGGVSMLRLKKSDEVLHSELLKRAMSMMRLRRTGVGARPVRGPSMMRLKRLPIFKDLMEEEVMCQMYPEYC